MNRKEKALVMGFVEYLQSVYGEGGDAYEPPAGPANSLLVPMFVGADSADLDDMPDFGALGSLMGGEGQGAGPLMGLDELMGNQAGGGMMGEDPAMDPMMMDQMMGMMG
jgi:hypothetical protein